MGTLKETYLALFVLFFRVGWKGPPILNWPARRAVGIITMIEAVCVGGLFLWMGIMTGQRVHPLLFIILIIPFFAVHQLNRHFLIKKGLGTEFEKQFDDLPRSKRIRLISSAIVVIVV